MVKEGVLNVSKEMGWQDLGATYYLLFAVGIWLALLSFYLIRTIGHYKRITKGVKGQNIGQILETVLSKQNLEAKQIAQILLEFKNLQYTQRGSFQKAALIRFNPFEDTGGDQSFAIAILDRGNNGLVISSLHSRGGTRIYAKQVNEGKATTHQFSKEEREVVEKAARQVRLGKN